MHAAYIRPGGISQDIPLNLLNDIFSFINLFKYRLDEIEELLSNNKIWKQRLLNVGLVERKNALSLGFTCVMLRCTGIDWDLRKYNPYEIYDKINFSIPTSNKGYCYARYLLRM